MKDVGQPPDDEWDGAANAPDALRVDLDGYEGPLDLLLDLARRQKVDLRRISVLDLARQYLASVEEARAVRLELAADYLVMAAWLAYLKSRLLLPPEPSGDGPSAEEEAERLAERLRHLEAIRAAAGALMARPRLGVDRFARGAPEIVAERRDVEWRASLLDLMQAYARLRTRDSFRPFVMDRVDVMTLADALERLRRMLGEAPEWFDLLANLPEGWETPARRRTALASTFAAALEEARHGRAELRQDVPFAALRVRAR